MPGVLYVVATPIGNLEDISLRALRILKEVDCVACEDTRHSGKLLHHFGISKPLVSCHEYNEEGRARELLGRLLDGENIALVSDAGTPLVSDPGYRLVALAVEAGIRVVPIPGVSAVTAALAASGLPTDCFRFLGFLPPKKQQRRAVFETLAAVTATVIFFEAPHRIVETLRDLEEILPRHPVVLARELTKIHEEFLRGTAAQLREILESRGHIKGEFTCLIGKGPIPAETEAAVSVEEAVSEYLRQGLSRMDAIKRVAKERGIPKRQAYQAFETSAKKGGRGDGRY